MKLMDAADAFVTSLKKIIRSDSFVAKTTRRGESSKGKNSMIASRFKKA